MAFDLALMAPLRIESKPNVLRTPHLDRWFADTTLLTLSGFPAKTDGLHQGILPVHSGSRGGQRIHGFLN